MITPKTNPNKQSVAEHYDDLDTFYRQIWGLHLHHGLWRSNRETPHEAVDNLVRFLAEKAKLLAGMSVCDIGCGYGETARMLADLWNVNVTAITLSKAQYHFAIHQAKKSDNPVYVLGDWLTNALPSDHFHVAFSIESSEHMEDKPLFFNEAYRVLKSNGKLAICAWLSKTRPNDFEVRFLLEPICREGRLPSMGSEIDYRNWLQQAGFRNIQYMDLTNEVKKTWSICVKRVAKAFLCNPDFRKAALDPTFKNRVFVKSVFRIWLAYQAKSMHYGFFIAEK